MRYQCGYSITVEWIVAQMQLGLNAGDISYLR